MGKPKARELADLRDLARPVATILVRVTPKAAYNAVLRKGDEIKVLVTSVPEGGKANVKVLELLARALRVSPSQLTLQRGATSRDKTFLLNKL